MEPKRNEKASFQLALSLQKMIDGITGTDNEVLQKDTGTQGVKFRKCEK